MFILIDKLESVPDPRSGNARKHKLGDILFMSIAAAVANGSRKFSFVVRDLGIMLYKNNVTIERQN